jgi:hypothetical protein
MSESENLPSPQTPQGPQPERLSDILPSLVPLAREYLANQARDVALRERELDHDARLDEKQIGIDAQQWRWQAALVAILCLAFLAIAAGLIFLLREINAGLLVLSHLAALATGVIGGLGWASRKGESGDSGDEG